MDPPSEMTIEILASQGAFHERTVHGSKWLLQALLSLLESKLYHASMFEVWSVFQVFRCLENLWPQVEEVARAAA